MCLFTRYGFFSVVTAKPSAGKHALPAAATSWSAPTWADVTKALAEDIDYPNFKSECEDAPGVDDAYTNMLHKIWELHHALQQPPSRSDQ